jgi:hypothetical protein
MIAPEIQRASDAYRCGDRTSISTPPSKSTPVSRLTVPLHRMTTKTGRGLKVACGGNGLILRQSAVSRQELPWIWCSMRTRELFIRCPEGQNDGSL